MSATDPMLAQAAQENPQETFRVIVRVVGDMDARQEQLKADGFEITRRLRLIRGFAATATGASVLRVMSAEWIISLERDGEVRTMRGDV